MRRFSSVILAAAFLLAAPAAPGFETFIHEFKLTKNGAIFFNDVFNDGIEPPQAPPLLIAPFNPVSYGVVGTYPDGSEAHGQLLLNSAFGNLAVSPVGGPVYIQFARVLTNSSPTSPAGLKDFHTFSVSGIFDTVPVPVGGGYGIALIDPQATAFNALSFGVRNLDGTGPKVGLQYVDNVNGISTVIGTETAVDSGRQIELQLVRASTASDVVTASYRYVGDTSFIEIADPMGLGRVFTSANWTQGEFRIFQLVPEPSTYLMLLAGLAFLVGVTRRRLG